MDTSKAKPPLDGIKVLELGHTVMGPTAGLILADLGAEVAKIEKAPQGDDTRRMKGFGAGFFSYFNRNKISLCLDLKDRRGRDVLDRLVGQADVLVENFGPGTIDRLGFGYERVSRLNPRLVFCSLKGFMPGPYEERLSLDEAVQMMGGLAYMTGPRGRPLRAGASVTDILGGTFGVVGILAALRERERTGKGQLVKATLFEAVAFMMAQHMTIAALTGEEPPPMPERRRIWAVYDLFPTADGKQVFLGITNEAHWTRFCEAFGFKDFLQDPDFETDALRIKNRDRLSDELMSRLGAMDEKRILLLAEKAIIPFAPISRPAQLLDDPHLKHAGWLLETKLPGGKTAGLPKIPLAIGDHSQGLYRHPPKLGEGGRAFLMNSGFSTDEVERLVNARVLVEDIDA
ncbi:MAG: CoA transferase [Deltaproteobacteria bacterium]|nr:CoA transferase [Deltaproteobacteria bacterium]MBW1816897.1 CoA transferase [Deltaproteobacteria bacterium]